MHGDDIKNGRHQAFTYSTAKKKTYFYRFCITKWNESEHWWSWLYGRKLSSEGLKRQRFHLTIKLFILQVVWSFDLSRLYASLCSVEVGQVVPETPTLLFLSYEDEHHLIHLSRSVYFMNLIMSIIWDIYYNFEYLLQNVYMLNVRTEYGWNSSSAKSVAFVSNPVTGLTGSVYMQPYCIYHFVWVFDCILAIIEHTVKVIMVIHQLPF